MEKNIYACFKQVEIKKGDGPREKLWQKGCISLSNSELIAIILGSGTQKHSVTQLAEEANKCLEQKSGKPDLESLCAINGIGKCASAKIAAAIELGKRLNNRTGIKIIKPEQIYPLVEFIADKKQEHFLTITLNGANEVIKVRTITIGILNRTVIHPREVFADAVTDRAAGIIVAHNHPSGSLEPSNEDKSITKRLKDAGKILGINLIDHIIVTTSDYFSFLENFLL
jgi:DNA repair protein RadC